jgi:hypothetical protein
MSRPPVQWCPYASAELLWLIVTDGAKLDLGVSDVRAQVEQAIARLGADSGVTHDFATAPPLSWPPVR